MATEEWISLGRSSQLVKVRGVYEIRSLITGASYVGSSINIGTRLQQHHHGSKVEYTSQSSTPSIDTTESAVSKFGCSNAVLRIPCFELSDIGKTRFNLLFVPAQPTLRPVVRKKLPPIALGNPIEGSELIRRFRKGEELSPVYCPIRGESLEASLRRAVDQAGAAGYRAVCIDGQVFNIGNGCDEFSEALA